MNASAPTVSAARTARLVGDLATSRPTYRALADALRLAVADGRIPAGTRLPSERDLTGPLGVSRTTVTRAYDVLRETGYLTSRRGSGSVATLPAGTLRRGTGGLFPADVADGVIDLTCAATRAPAGVVEAYERAVARLPAYLCGAGYLTHGVPDLREAIAQRYRDRGLPTSADDVLVTSGAVAGLGVVVRALLRPGDRVVVEDPSYPNTVDALRAAGARLRPLVVDPDGWDVEEAERTLTAAAGRAAVLIPDFHNPTGALMPDEQRARLAHRLRTTGTTPVVDESIVEVDLDGGAAVLPFAAHAPEAVSIGSSSKSHWGGLRTGWVRAPRGALRSLVEARVSGDLGAPVLEQLVLAELMQRSPGLTAERRTDLVASRTALAEALAAELPDVRFRVPRGGLSLWCELPVGLSSTALTAAAEDEGLLVAAGPRFAVEGGLDRWLRLPHPLPPATMTEAVRRLARAAERVRSGRAAPGPARVARPGRPLVA
ncbi:PLP-dependent aminotransferase family protein [Phycicoccus sp. HDW14]|uniref:MocR-like transcription factor YczR n=1 Tax=Phycicoccus sp. HDW14 TaxID=2714941 RepID=UPI00140D584F|nr:PLP-dependent aminotransferase family protein [Phycicoccus sp. HDW14]QIM21301.1 PLP-dependent aminotransferase family protein [Phycicoccus sp. HDW14]